MGLGVEVLNLDKGVAYHDLVVLVAAHEARERDLAVEDALVSEGGRLGTQHQGDVIAHAVGGNAVNLHAVPLDGRDTGVTLLLGKLATQEVGLANEVGHKLVDGTIVDGVRVANLVDDAALHDNDPVGDGHGLGLVVRDVNGRDARLLLDAAHLGAHLNAKLGVKVREGLVEEQDRGLDDQGTRQRNALLLAARELVGHTVFHAL